MTISPPNLNPPASSLKLLIKSFPKKKSQFFLKQYKKILVVANPLRENLLQSAKYSKSQVNYLKKKISQNQ